MGYATIQGRHVYYNFPQEAEANIRKGFSLFMVHGYYDNHVSWSSQYLHLEHEHNPLVIDLPGHGDSQGPPLNNSQDFRRFIKAFVEVLDIEPFVFLGHSMGGSMALDFAIHYPDSLNGIILINTATRSRDFQTLIEMWKINPKRARNYSIINSFSAKTPSHIRERYNRRTSDTPDEVCLADIENCASYNLDSKINKIELPTLVIYGNEENLPNDSTIFNSTSINIFVINC